MSRFCALALAIALLVLPDGGAADAAPPPTHQLVVSGVGVTLTPAFDASIERYAVDTTAETGGTVTISAGTSDPSGIVSVNGRPAPNGTRTVTGLDDGDEISVIIEDIGGRSVHSLVYLPADFPRLTTVVDEPGQAPGDVMLTLSKWTAPSPSYETAIDANGVPSYVREMPAGTSILDLKPAPFGHYTAFRGPTPTPGRTGAQAVELDESFQPVRVMETVGLKNTDNHDVILRPDGSRIMVAYERDTASGLDDAVIQEVDADGDVVYTWNSADHMDPLTETTNTPGQPDYAHINSIQEMADGDVLASFRHTSSVMKIAWSDHDGHQRGDVVWRLGGRFSDFEFVDDPYLSGPCAQHTANQLPNGHVLIFDNGSGALGENPSLCVDPADPTGPTINRTQTRITEYALDEQAGTATLVWSHEVAGRFAFFAGSVRRLTGGNTLIGWAAAQQATATEVDPSGDPVWEIKTADGYFTYRAAKAVIPDAIAPAVGVSVPREGATYGYGKFVAPRVTCTDRGGSSLQTCQASHEPLDTVTPGRHTYQVTATDGDGNVTAITRHYTVAEPVFRPDALVRGRSGWVGDDVYAGRLQAVRIALRRTGSVGTSVVRLQNDGDGRDRLLLAGADGGRHFRVRYLLAGADVTRRVVAGTFRTAWLDPGAEVRLKLRIKRLSSASRGDARIIRVRVTSLRDGRRRDMVATDVRASRAR